MYATGLPAEVRLSVFTRVGCLPYVFEASGTETRTTNGYDPEPRSRRLFADHGLLHPRAIEEARRVSLRIELIDGKRLAELMLRHGVGVQAGIRRNPDETGRGLLRGALSQARRSIRPCS